MNEKYAKSSITPTFVKMKETEKVSKTVEKHKTTIDLSVPWNQSLTTITTLAVLICFQIAISLNPHSGESQPPMYGDYEAQRHWMEITFNLPIEHWYVNGSHNDLLYWGLDYPPLTAYHHNLLGVITYKINKRWVELRDSRGFESVAHKIFMRVSAIVPFYIFYLPPLIYALMSSKKTSPVLYPLSLLYPALLVIDNGHFQYNSVSLGLFLFAYIFLIQNWTLLGSMFFVAALNYKQMELYHALPVFVFILSRSINQSQPLGTILKLAKIGVMVLSTFLIIWLPFILTETAKDVLIRVFPFNRGLYEDKVASFWCAFSFVLKRLPIVQNVQIYLSTALVLICSLPSLVSLFLQPSERNFRLSLTTTALSFFLFSFHVHEKTILLATIPALLLLPEYPSLVILFLNISNISIFSLCIKDNFPFALVFFFAYFVVSYSVSVYNREAKPLHILSISIGFLICILEMYGPANQRFPHIYQLANAFFSCLNFLYLLVSFTIAAFEKVKKE
ncbi:hypothetical protein L3Y34_017228 [Caenorhabditis briggsae]|uniref:Alpha-1,3-glucosyltransferase n=2 Tax=Caenorhabditis briggsae TaxID=6238 RepID=A0AAE9DHN9_CAEBR|nr:hypothetical protein L3Y34_017228 [Caenorhabditis briggsae]